MLDTTIRIEFIGALYQPEHHLANIGRVAVLFEQTRQAEYGLPRTYAAMQDAGFTVKLFKTPSTNELHISDEYAEIARIFRNTTN